jgi:hypothetical protein
MFVFVDVRIVMCSQCVYQGLIEILLSVFLILYLIVSFFERENPRYARINSHYIFIKYIL